MTRFVVTVWLCIATATPALAADDSAAAFLVNLFDTACVPNMGNPDRVRAWAGEKHLTGITNPTALGIFVGSGGKGGAWAVPASVGNFALSIRGTTQACAVWARVADPVQVEAYFRKIIEGVKRPGLTVRVDRDATTPTPAGQAHALVYNIAADSARTGYEFTMLTAERPGGPFQASLQVGGSLQP